MPDYVLTKDPDKTTGELPDKLTIILPPHHAWLIIKQMLIQLEQGKELVRLDLLGKMERK